MKISIVKTLSILSLIILITVKVFANDELINNKINQLASLEAEDLNVGVYIKDLTNKKDKFSFHSNRLFVPASVTKIITSYMALEYLGKDFRFQTIFSSDQQIDSNSRELNSNLYIKFNADPTLKFVDLQKIFKILNIHKIHKNIIIDGSSIDDYPVARGGFTWDNATFCYAAPKSAIVIDKNCSEAWMTTDISAQDYASLKIDRPYVLKIENNVNIVSPRKQECPYKSKYITNNTYDVYGCMFSNLKTPVRLNFALQDNKKMIHDYIMHLLKENNIKFYGNIKFGISKGKTMLYIHESPPLQSILSDVLQESCNVSASTIFKTIAAKKTGKTGNDEDGERVLRRFLQNKGLNTKSFKFKDGAGESRYNIISPRSLVGALERIYSSNKILEIFKRNLAQYGKEGTLRYRNIKNPYKRYIYAKTGTLENYSAIAGFYLPPKGNQYAFAIMISNHNLSWNQVKSLEDKILLSLLKS